MNRNVKNGNRSKNNRNRRERERKNWKFDLFIHTRKEQLDELNWFKTFKCMLVLRLDVFSSRLFFFCALGVFSGFDWNERPCQPVVVYHVGVVHVDIFVIKNIVKICVALFCSQLFFPIRVPYFCWVCVFILSWVVLKIAFKFFFIAVATIE